MTRSISSAGPGAGDVDGRVDFTKVDTLMRQGVLDQVFPGAVLRVARGRAVLYRRAFGVSDLSSGKAITPETIFDLASLTKPLATTLAILSLVQDGVLSLDSAMGAFLPPFRKTPKEAILVRHLLCHTSGLPAHRPYYRELASLPAGERPAGLHDLLAAEPLIHAIGERCVYSDLGFMVLRWLAEEISGMRLDRFLTQRIYCPLDIPLFYIDLAMPTPPGAFAATQRCPWRGRVLEGVVGDENAYVLGGVEGHAGLFGTADAVGRLLEEVTAVYRGEPNQGLLSQQWVRTFLQQDPLSGRTLGFDMPTPEGSSSGHFFSDTTVGHLGYTGTSFWADLATGISVVLLTNRVHPDADNPKIRAFRPIIHDAVLTALLGF